MEESFKILRNPWRASAEKSKSRLLLMTQPSRLFWENILDVCHDPCIVCWWRRRDGISEGPHWPTPELSYKLPLRCQSGWHITRSGQNQHASFDESDLSLLCHLRPQRTMAPKGMCSARKEGTNKRDGERASGSSNWHNPKKCMKHPKIMTVKNRM